MELIIVGAVLAVGVLGRVALRRPWVKVIEARSCDPVAAERLLEWRVAGWRKSTKLIEQVASDLSAGRDPGMRHIRG